MILAACFFLLTGQALKWGGFILGLCALCLLAELIREHWSAGRALDRDQEDDQP